MAYLFVDICFLTVIAKRLNDSLRTVEYEMQPRAYTLQPNTKTKMTDDSFKNMLLIDTVNIFLRVASRIRSKHLEIQET